MFFLLCGASAYGELDNTTRDYATDIKTKIKTTSTLLGLKFSTYLKWSLLGISILGFTWVIFFSNYFKFSSGFLIFFILSMLTVLSYTYIKFLKHKDQRKFERQMNQTFILIGNINLLLYYVGIFNS
jgi:1,4-dihydroxy-2-naphthoate octaprenyltransferase